VREGIDASFRGNKLRSEVKEKKKRGEVLVEMLSPEDIKPND